METATPTSGAAVPVKIEPEHACSPTCATRRAVLLGGAGVVGAAALAACGSSSSGAAAAGAAGTSSGTSASSGAAASSAAATSDSTAATTAATSAATTADAVPSRAPAALAQLADIPVGGAISAKDATGAPIVIAQPTAGTVTAFSAICTHMGCTVAPKGHELDCPCHGSRYNAATGAVLAGPAPKALSRVAVKVVGGAVVAA